MALALVVVTGCGKSSPANPQPSTTPKWSAAKLATVILPATALPSPFAAVSDTKGASGAYDLQRKRSYLPAGPVRDAVARDGFEAGYRRNWAGTTPAAGYVELTAFHDAAGAKDFVATWVEFLRAHGQTGTPAEDVAPGAVAFIASGSEGETYSVIAQRNGVVVQVAAGGGGITLAGVEQLLTDQLRRL